MKIFKIKIRCPHPNYETHPIDNNVTIIEKKGWKS